MARNACPFYFQSHGQVGCNPVTSVSSILFSSLFPHGGYQEAIFFSFFFSHAVEFIKSFPVTAFPFLSQEMEWMMKPFSFPFCHVVFAMPARISRHRLLTRAVVYFSPFPPIGPDKNEWALFSHLFLLETHNPHGTHDSAEVVDLAYALESGCLSPPPLSLSVRRLRWRFFFVSSPFLATTPTAAGKVPRFRAPSLHRTNWFLSSPSFW